MASTILLQLMRGVWAIEPIAAQGYIPVVAAMMKGQTVNLNQLMPEQASKTINLAMAGATPVAMPHWLYGFQTVKTSGTVAMVPLRGSVLKYDFCGSPGTKTMASWYAQIEANPNIIGSVMLIDSPGGSADGTGLFSDFLRQTSKPKVGLIEGMCCSAAMWIGSANTELYASYKTDIIGSIGTYFTLPDYSKQLEAEGIKVHEIYATQSTDKNGIFKAALEGNYEPLRKELIDPFNQSFLTGMTKNRYGKGLNKEAVFTGKTFMAADAQKYGLIDGTMNLQAALQRVQKLAA